MAEHKKNEIKKIMKARKMLDHQLKAKLKERLLEVIGDNDVDHGFTLTELSGKVLEKAYVSNADTQEVYKIITAIRNDTNECLAFRNGKYGWAKDKETVDIYRLTNIENGLKKVKSNVNKLPKNYKALGIKDNPFLMLNSKVKEFGIKFIERRPEEIKV